MKHTRKTLIAVAAAAAIAGTMLAGCGSTADTSGQTQITSQVETSDQSQTSGQTSEERQTQAPAASSQGENADTGTETSSGTSSSAASSVSDSDLFSDRDMEQTADLSDAEYITVSDGQDVTITEEGVYVISGTASEVAIRVEVDDASKVQLVLDGVSITNSDSPCIYVVSADKVFVTTTDSENSLTVTGEFAADGDTNTDAVIFSKDDLTLNGVGTLTIVSTDNGISCKDELVITGGTYVIDSTEHCIEANDSLAIAEGTFTLTSADKDGMHCENDEDYSLGNIYITGGTFTISTSSDGIEAGNILQIDGGTFTIDAEEGLEGPRITINDGDVTINASDDGINASDPQVDGDANMNGNDGSCLTINGGTITITMGAGDTDALDSNGDIIITGGTVYITATSAFDYNGTGTLSGGTVYVNGQQITSLTNSMMGGMGGMMPGQDGTGTMPGQDGTGTMPGQMGGGNMPGQGGFGGPQAS